LARLRPLGVLIYVVPRHGLFGWVACPHYLGEILSFVGYAMMSDLLPVWGNALVAAAYLSARANSTLSWYRREMPLQIPSRWRRLVPFAY
jgi:3-oxo-5-alpha-steroid 4-dehydrogenase 1